MQMLNQGEPMKPGSKDVKVKLLISGLELEELQRYTWMMAESFGLDRRIGNYQGRRTIGLYGWDFECLLAVISPTLEDPKYYPSKTRKGYLALAALRERLSQIYKENFPD
jgi:hypothetical protein